MEVIILSVGIVIVGVYAQVQRMISDRFAEALVETHRWIDEIIEALEDPDQVQGDRSVHRLVAERIAERRDSGDPD